MVRVVVIAFVLALALVGAGCGGGDDEASSDTDTVVVDTTDETTTDDTTTEDDTTTDDEVDLGDFLSGECEELVAAYAALSQAFGAASTGGAEGFDETADVFRQFADEAPEEIRGDIRILADAYAEFAAKIGDFDFQAGEVPDAEALQALQAASEAFNEPEVMEAGERLTAWTTENCG
jgi:hypothetical protein